MAKIFAGPCLSHNACLTFFYQWFKYFVYNGYTHNAIKNSWLPLWTGSYLATSERWNEEAWKQGMATFKKMSNYNQSVNSTIFTWAVASAGDSHVSLLSNPLEDCHMICLFLVQAEFQPIHPPKWGLWEFVLNWLYFLCFFLIQDVDVLGNDILSLVYYFFNLMPLSRGSRYR